MRSKAAIALDSEPGTQTEKAEKYDLDQGAFSRYVRGMGAPAKRGKLKIHERGGPAPELWDEYPEPPKPVAKPDLELVPVVATPEEVAQTADRILSQLNAEVAALEAMPESEGRVRALKDLAAAAKNLGGLTGDGILSENQIQNSPAFRELKRVILRALEPFPDATLAVISALEARQ